MSASRNYHLGYDKNYMDTIDIIHSKSKAKYIFLAYQTLGANIIIIIVWLVNQPLACSLHVLLVHSSRTPEEWTTKFISQNQHHEAAISLLQ